uniref:VWFC domain-containing protein n=1 Tax=Plectus sambesii TaxID=2011161 RepID=A0A914UQ74_9BILA
MPDARGVVLMICLLVAAPSPSDAFLFDPEQGSDTSCTNEGGLVSVKEATGGRLQDDPCLSCTCKNGTVSCEKQRCPNVDTCPVATLTPGTCCRQCKTCSYLGQIYNNGDQWGSSQDACRTLSCKAGVITIARMQCITPCHNPQRLVGYCCPVCQPPDVGILIATAEMALLQNLDPCLQCTPNREHWSHCFRTACPALDCPLAAQYTPDKQCCPECRATRTLDWSPAAVPSRSCSFQLVTYDHLQSFRPDDCTLCKCEV